MSLSVFLSVSRIVQKLLGFGQFFLHIRAWCKNID